MQAIGELDDDDANFLRHGEKHLRQILRLDVLRRSSVDLLRLFAQRRTHLTHLGLTLDDPSHCGAVALLERFKRHRVRVLHRVVQQTRDETLVVEFHLRQDGRHGDRMRDVRLPALSSLSIVRVERHFQRVSHLRALEFVQVPNPSRELGVPQKLWRDVFPTRGGFGIVVRFRRHRARARGRARAHRRLRRRRPASAPSTRSSRSPRPRRASLARRPARARRGARRRPHLEPPSRATVDLVAPFGVVRRPSSTARPRRRRFVSFRLERSMRFAQSRRATRIARASVARRRVASRSRSSSRSSSPSRSRSRRRLDAPPRRRIARVAVASNRARASDAPDAAGVASGGRAVDRRRARSPIDARHRAMGASIRYFRPRSIARANSRTVNAQAAPASRRHRARVSAVRRSRGPAVPRRRHTARRRRGRRRRGDDDDGGDGDDDDGDDAVDDAVDDARDRATRARGGRERDARARIDVDARGTGRRGDARRRGRRARKTDDDARRANASDTGTGGGDGAGRRGGRATRGDAIVVVVVVVRGGYEETDERRAETDGRG